MISIRTLTYLHILYWMRSKLNEWMDGWMNVDIDMQTEKKIEGYMDTDRIYRSNRHLAYALSTLLQLDMISSANDETERSKCVQNNNNNNNYKIYQAIKWSHKNQMTSMKSQCVSDECAIIPKNSWDCKKEAAAAMNTTQPFAMLKLINNQENTRTQRST